MITLPRTALALSALALTTACGGSSSGVAGVSGGPTAIEAFQDRLDRQDKMEDRVLGLAGSTWTAVPTTGTADFNGLGTVEIDRTGDGASDDINLIGFAEIEADFANDSITGQITNIQGYTGGTPRAATLFDAEGSIVIGDISSDLEDRASGRSNVWTADYEGDLATSEGRIRLDGTLDGRFRGTRPSETGSDVLTAIAGDDSDGRARVAGAEADSMFIQILGLN